MKKNLYALVFGMVLSVLVLPSISYAEGTPDGETPATEGVCDELKDGTRGLYGLCVAYCEAQDLNEAEMEKLIFGDDRTVRRILRRNASSPKILKLYAQKQEEGDPNMPCINQDSACPCFDKADLEKWRDTYTPDNIQYGPVTWKANNSESFVLSVVINSLNCSVVDPQRVLLQTPESGQLIGVFDAGDPNSIDREACIQHFEDVNWMIDP